MNVRVYEIDPDAGPLKSQIEVFAKQTKIGRVTDDTWVGLRALRDGAPIVVPWKQALIFEGVCYRITVGAFSTPATGGGTASVIDLDRPEFTVAMTGTSRVLLPLDVRIQIQSAFFDGDGEEYEALIAADRTQAITGGTATAEVIFNARTDNLTPSSATAQSDYTADLSPAPVLDIELARTVAQVSVEGVATEIFVKYFKLDYVPEAAPLLVAPCTLLGYWGGGTTVNGFAQVMWAELPLSAFT